jgi:replication factor C small subunit
MVDPSTLIWTERYRPKKLGDVVGDFRGKISKYLENQQTVPNFLFHSKVPGTGKTTLAKVIINELGCDALILNSSDDRKIETVRDKVKEFALTKSSKVGIRRCVFMDEFDGMLKASQEALRNVMETYASNVFFILTCNNINKVIEPIKSRCVVIPFAYPNKEEVQKYLENIANKEKMDYTEEGIKKLVELNYPSIRNCVIALQDLYTEGKAVTEDTVRPVTEIFDVMWEYLKLKKWQDIKKAVMESTLDPRDLNTYFWMKALEQETPDIKLIQLTCRNEKDISVGADAKIVFVTSLIEMVK